MRRWQPDGGRLGGRRHGGRIAPRYGTGPGWSTGGCEPAPERRLAQAASRARPLRRRADRIARPARVRIRRRKPCVLCRRRLLGWKVRLLTSSLHCVVRYQASGSDPGPRCGRSAAMAARRVRVQATMVGLGSTALRYVAASEGVKLTSSSTFSSWPGSTKTRHDRTDSQPVRRDTPSGPRTCGQPVGTGALGLLVSTGWQQRHPDP